MGAFTQMSKVVVGIAVLAGVAFMSVPDVLTGVSSDVNLKQWQIHAALVGFCLSPVPDMLMKQNRVEDMERESTIDVAGQGFEYTRTEERMEGKTTGGDFEFEKDGDIENDDYNKASIYSILYGLYANAGEVICGGSACGGVPYQFTVNTWGIAGPTLLEGAPKYGPEDPQRHGKAAYTGLVSFPEVKDYMAANGDNPTIVEIGCGTGAGANLITRELIPNAHYIAIDMQFAAIETCKKIHGNAENPGLYCRQESGGVGNNGNKVRNEKGEVMPDGSVDFVIISETHIADVEIGPEEKEIFNEILRVLKPGGMFLWGNALPTRVWLSAEVELKGLGFDRIASLNHTKGAVLARDEDLERVESYAAHLYGQYPMAFKMPVRGAMCEKVVDRLLLNFYRHPGTALYLKMVTGYDSYMHEVYQKPA
jgi:SAM-dependent methyltransferase